MAVSRRVRWRLHSPLSLAVSRSLSSANKSIFLPRTAFPRHVASSERAALDQRLAAAGELTSLYDRQAELRNGERAFELLDGPPYANGPVHCGHAINKILKDFIVKSRIQAGRRVRFRPGWDCHGLPIELKITKSVAGASPLEIRALAREVASAAAAKQMNSFKRWGVTADWGNPYYTMHPLYVAAQLRAFAKLFEKGFVYRAFRPVYWSPSSMTALAESELEYNEQHKSTAVHFRFKVIDVALDSVLPFLPYPHRPVLLYALTWTTTPWTLPLNDAISLSPGQEYSLIQFDDECKNPVTELYAVASASLPSLAASLSTRSFQVRATVPAEAFTGKHYRSCWHNELARPFVMARHVATDKGTGCVHTAYAHGMDDYQVAVGRGESVAASFVDDRGLYTREMGQLEGMHVLGEGSKKVLQALRNDVVWQESYRHSYPYDWRTKKPVIIRTSAQWFVDTARVAGKAEELLERVTIRGGQSDLSNSLRSMVLRRPAWCISRQRAWGVPIPAIHKGEESMSSRALIERVAAMVEETGDSDIWWKSSEGEVLAEEGVRKSLGLEGVEGVRKGSDIMDVWMDSGLAWHAAREAYGDASSKVPADAVSEGVDQFRGWFQSLLVTSLAINESLPYKQVFVHGFCVDEKGKKMSKSLGNGIDPDTVADGSLGQQALGADGLRLWVALQAAESGGESRMGPAVLADIQAKISALRNCLRFVLGGLEGMNAEWKLERGNLPLLDQWILYRTLSFCQLLHSHYDSYRFRAAANELLRFTQLLSSSYINLVRDRLYCHRLGSPQHSAAQFTLDKVASAMALCLSPLMPHLAIEVEEHRIGGMPASLLTRALPTELKELAEGVVLHPQLLPLSDLLSALRSQMSAMAGPKTDVTTMNLHINLSASSLQLLATVSEEEVVEMLGVSGVEMREGKESLLLSPPILLRCDRCRRFRRHSEHSLCHRCTEALVSSSQNL